MIQLPRTELDCDCRACCGRQADDTRGKVPGSVLWSEGGEGEEVTRLYHVYRTAAPSGLDAPALTLDLAGSGGLDAPILTLNLPVPVDSVLQLSLSIWLGGLDAPSITPDLAGSGGLDAPNLILNLSRSVCLDALDLTLNPARYGGLDAPDITINPARSGGLDAQFPLGNTVVTHSQSAWVRSHLRYFGRYCIELCSPTVPLRQSQTLSRSK